LAIKIFRNMRAPIAPVPRHADAALFREKRRR
jgi:hypothetical protein